MCLKSSSMSFVLTPESNFAINKAEDSGFAVTVKQDHTDKNPVNTCSIHKPDCDVKEPKQLEVCIKTEQIDKHAFAKEAGLCKTEVEAESQASVAFGTNLPPMNRDPEPTHCTSLELASPQANEYVEMHANSPSHHQTEGKRSQIFVESYQFILVDSNKDVLRRHSSENSSRTEALDGRKIQEEQVGACVSYCNACGKALSRVKNLKKKNHSRCLTGEKPDQCKLCSQCFYQAGDIKKHRRVHTEEKPFPCDHCGKSFSQRENVKRPQNIHFNKNSLKFHQNFLQQ